MMGLIENQERSCAERPQPVAEWGDVGLVDQEAMGDEKSRMGGPWIYTETALSPDFLDVVFVEDLKGQSEPRVEFLLPLQEHGWRAGYDNFSCLFSEQQFSCDEPSFYRLAKADVIGNEQVHARELQRFAQRLQLVGFDLDAGAEG